MYEQYFHLKKRPFSIAPDPGFLYLSDRHRDALAHLKYGLESDGGFVLVTGEVGTGKTTLLRNIIGQVPGDIDVAFILNPRLTVRELLQTICDELAIEYPTEDQHSVKPYIDRLNKHLLQTHQDGRSTVVVIDEAQNLSPAVLEQLRLLTNLETNERKLLRIILVGQPELRTMLARQELRQLSQRITARYHLEPLALADTRAYLAHRLSVSGGNPNLFSGGASWNIHRHAGGIPRLINIIADRAMLGAYADGKLRIDFLTSQKAARETLSERKNLPGWLAVAGAVALAAIGSWWFLTAAPPGAQSSPEPLTEIVVRNPDSRPDPQLQSRSSALPSEAPNYPEPSYRQPQPPAPTEKASVADLVPRPAIGSELLGGPPVLSAGETGIGTPVLTPPLMSRPSGGEIARQPLPSANRLPQPTDNLPSYRSLRQEFETLYRLWGITYEADDVTVPCDYAPRYQLQCTKRITSWEGLQRLNVPVVMELTADDGQQFYATATSAHNGRVSLNLGAQRSVVEITALQRIWDGTIIALWPTPENYTGSLKAGSSGEAVRELRELLGSATQRNLGDSSTFDAELGRALLEFQAANGLLQDGIAGPATWLLLHRAAGYDIPELLS